MWRLREGGAGILPGQRAGALRVLDIALPEGSAAERTEVLAPTHAGRRMVEGARIPNPPWEMGRPMCLGKIFASDPVRVGVSSGGTWPSAQSTVAWSRA